MARPKDKSSLRVGACHSLGMSQAFANKSHQELEKLQLKVATGLTEDLVRLLEEELHTDFIITNGTCEVRAHHCILQTRAKHAWPEGLVYSTTGAEGSNLKCLRMNDLTEKQIRDFVRQIYSVKDSELLFEEFLPHILGELHSEKTENVTNDTEIEDNNSHIEDLKEKSAYCPATDVNLDLGGNTFCNPTNVLKDNENESYCDDVKDAQNGFKHEDVSKSVLNSQQDSITDPATNGCPDTHNDNFISAYVHLETHNDNVTNVNHETYGQIAPTSPKDIIDIIQKSDITNDQENKKIEALNDCVSNFPTPHLECKINSGVSDDTFVTGSGLEVALENLSLEAKQLTEAASRNHNDFTGIMATPCASSAENIDVVRENESIHGSNQVPTRAKSNDFHECTEPVDAGKNSTAHTNTNEPSDSTNVTHYVNPYETCSPLGNDLLHLYLQQQSCDCCLSVEGVHFLAHKCVLSARSSYFSAMFGGQWSESNLEVVQLEGVSASAMEKVLLFFYGGVTDGITSFDIFDLFIIADMYGVETLKLVLQFFLKRDMCHFFHKPCSSCIARAPEALNLCHNFHLEELQDRLLKWVSKHFTKIWCTKTFASLSEDLHQVCVTAVVNQMTEINVLDIIMDCDRLTTSLPRIKWTESILCLTTQLMDLAIEYTSTHFIKVIHAPEFLTWAKIASWKASALEEIFNSVIDSLPVDTAISVYQTLIDLKSRETMGEACEQNLIDLLDTMIKRCEKFLRTHIFMVTRSKQWSSINKSFQSQILENSSYLHLDHFPDPKPRPQRPVLSSSLSKPKLRSVSPSSASASSHKASKHLTSRVTSQSHLRLKPTNPKVISSNAPEKTRTDHTVASVKGKMNSEAASKQAKTLKSSTRPPPKATEKSVSVDGSVSNPKASSSGLDVRHKDNQKSKSQHLTYSFKQFSEKSKNPSMSSSVKLSTSLSSDKKFIGLGKSPPSRLPLKMSREKTPEKHILHPQESLSEFNSALSSSQPAASLDHQVLISEGMVEDEQDPGRVCVVFMTEKNSTDASHAAKFDSVMFEGHDMQEEGRKESEKSGLEASHESHENGRGDLSVVHDGTKDQDESAKIQTGDSIEDSVNHRSGDHSGNSSDVHGCVQQEMNFVQTVQPLKISFVVPTDDNSNRKLL